MILLPRRSMENGVIHMVCDLYHIDGRKYKPDPRTLLKNALDQAHALDLDLLMASKFEFYLLNATKRESERRFLLMREAIWMWRP